jgi:methionyl aminopeptidase
MEKEILEKYLQAGKIAAAVREESRKFIKIGAPLLEIAEKIESLIREKGTEPAFPVNISINESAAHYTPSKKDETTIKKDDLIKIDIGVHVDGYVGDTAYSFSFSKDNEKLIEASQRALDEAIKLCKPNILLSDISSTIEETIKGFGFNPISNLTGHGLDRYDLHAEPQIPNVKFKSGYSLKEDQIIAIEPFATNGSGMIKESEPTLIFRLVEKRPVRNQDARTIIKFAESFRGLPFTERWIPIDSVVKIRIALRELRERGIIYDYPVLKEVSNGTISQAEHTVIVKDEPIITTDYIEKKAEK